MFFGCFKNIVAGKVLLREGDRVLGTCTRVCVHGKSHESKMIANGYQCHYYLIDFIDKFSKEI